MDALSIVGGATLRGTVRVSGAKNATLPIMAAALLASGESVLKNVPDLADVRTLAAVLRGMGVTVTQHGAELHLGGERLASTLAPYELVRKMRAAILVLGPLLARCGEAQVSLPGGCAIGTRPIDEHLRGLTALGAEIAIEHGYVHARAPRGLTGARVRLAMPTVTGTENVLLAACLARGTTVIEQAACEPEVVDLALALTAMGAVVHGAGTPEITVHGQPSLRPYTHTVVADRIECGTLLVAGALCGGPLTVAGAVVHHQTALLAALEQVGMVVEATAEGLNVWQAVAPRGIALATGPYPGFPTDMQAQLMTLLALSAGSSSITETIFENRFMHVAELDRLGAQIRVDGRRAAISGVPRLSGSTVMATDLRASACLVLAGLMAEGTTVVRRIYHLDRGYEHLEKKLRAVGANIARIKEA